MEMCRWPFGRRIGRTAQLVTHCRVMAATRVYWRIGDLTFTGIALGSIAALVIYHGMRGLRRLRGSRDQNGGGLFRSAT